MATRTVAGSNTPAHPAPKGPLPAPEVSYLFEPSRTVDLAGAGIPAIFAQVLVDRVQGVCRGAAVLAEMLDQDSAEADDPDEGRRIFDAFHHGVLAGLLRHSLELLADDVLDFANRSRKLVEPKKTGDVA